jgi:hypothetical protein
MSTGDLEALAALAPHLPAEQQPAVYAEALAAAQAIAAADDRAKALAVLAPHLPTDLLADALAAARTIGPIVPAPRRWPRSPPTCPPSSSPPSTPTPSPPLGQLLTMTGVSALAALAPHLPAEQQPAVYADALAAARAIESDFSAPERWPRSPPTWQQPLRSMNSLCQRCAPLRNGGARRCSVICERYSRGWRRWLSGDGNPQC